MGQQRNWTPQEDEYLESKWGFHTIPQIAKALGRSPHGVKLKIMRRGLGRAVLSAECLNAKQVSTLLNVDYHTVTDYWIAKCGLKTRRVAPHGTRKQYFIKIPDLLSWLEHNQDKWDSRRVEKFALGIEPDWLKDKRAADDKLPKNLGKRWTEQEDRLIIMYYYEKGYTYPQIGEIMGRSKQAVENRFLRLRRKQKEERRKHG